jgi:DNA-binding XRE family transcriptional regulator
LIKSFEDEGHSFAEARRSLGEEIEKKAGGRPTLKSLRLRAGLSQAEVAEVMQTQQSYVARLETGKDIDPRWSTLVRLAAALHVNIHVIVEAIDA